MHIAFTFGTRSGRHFWSYLQRDSIQPVNLAAHVKFCNRFCSPKARTESFKQKINL
jgi:hypothetical protein